MLTSINRKGELYTPCMERVGQRRATLKEREALNAWL